MLEQYPKIGLPSKFLPTNYSLEFSHLAKISLYRKTVVKSATINQNKRVLIEPATKQKNHYKESIRSKNKIGIERLQSYRTIQNVQWFVTSGPSSIAMRTYGEVQHAVTQDRWTGGGSLPRVQHRPLFPPPPQYCTE
jgi:hypothetical protein